MSDHDQPTPQDKDNNSSADAGGQTERAVPSGPSIEAAGIDMPKATSSAPLIVIATLISVGAIIIGFNSGKGWSSRVERNLSLRDSLILQYEIDSVAKLFDELDAVINAAVLKSGKRAYDSQHIEFLKNRVKDNPIKSNLLIERSHKSFGRQASERLVGYYMKWTALHQMASLHCGKTLSDEKALRLYSKKMEKINSASYGVVFKRQGSKLLGNLVYVGTPMTKGNTVKYPVKTSSNATGEPRTLYNPAYETEKSGLVKSPEAFFVEVAAEEKNGLLASAASVEFDAYVRRLYEMTTLMKAMRDDQTGLMRSLAELASQEPTSLAFPNPEEGFAAYVAQNKH